MAIHPFSWDQWQSELVSQFATGQICPLLVTLGNTLLFHTGSTVKCYNEGENVVVPFIHNDPCYQCKCLGAEIVCLDTCGHKKCTTSSGKVYKNNESWNNGTCTKCTCNSGKINCQEKLCPPVDCGPRAKLASVPGQCCPKCIETSAQCTLTGKVDKKSGQVVRKVSTFDAARYSFDGKCNYVLTRDCGEKGFSIHLAQEIDESIIARSTRRVSSQPGSSFKSLASSFLPLTGPPRDIFHSVSVYNNHLSRTLDLSPSSSSSSPPTPWSVTPLLSATSNATLRSQSGLPSWLPQTTLDPSSQSTSTLNTLSQVAPNFTTKGTQLTNGHLITLSLVFKIGKTKVRLTPTNGPGHWKVRVGNKNASLPFIQFGTITIVKDPLSSKKQGRASVLIWTNLGIKVTWDGGNDLAITMPAKVKSTVCGLCGNYNGNKSDDLHPKRGPRAKSVSEFIESWKVGTNNLCRDKFQVAAGGKKKFGLSGRRSKSPPPPLMEA